MYTAVSRAAHGPRALLVAMLAALGACADDPVAPRTPSTPKPNASALASGWSA